jgi:hypothetical protein
MKDVPKHIKASAPEDTVWFGGPVDLTKVALRVAGKDPQEKVNFETISRLLGCNSDAKTPSIWRLRSPDSEDGDIDSQVEWILSRLTQDLNRWNEVSSQFSIDLFCGLFLERTNRGTSLFPETMRRLADRGIKLSLDIYAPEPNKAAQVTPLRSAPGC